MLRFGLFSPSRSLLASAAARAKLLTAISSPFAIDTRSLAVFRVGLALAILTDLVLRSRDLTAHYTDAGALPRALLAADVGSRLSWAPILLKLNPHFLFGGTGGQILLFVAAGVLALLLLVGWRTRWVTVASWVLLTSLQSRNPAALNSGDVVLRLLLFWSMFLPLGARWSLEAARYRWPPHARVVGGAAAALLLQVAMVYGFNAQFKVGAAWTTDYTAVEYLLRNAIYASPLGVRLLDYPELPIALTRLVIVLEKYGWVLVFCPFLHGPVRTLTVSLFAVFHAGLLLSTTIKFFSLVCLVAWLPFLPTWLWNLVEGHKRDGVWPRGDRPRWQTGAALLILGYIFLWNAQTLWGWPVPGIARAPGYLLRVDQRWAMFSPQPPTATSFMAARGQTAAGSNVDLLTGRVEQPGEWAPPAGHYATERWRDYFAYAMSGSGSAGLREGLATYLQQRWTHGGGDQLTGVRLYTVREPIQVPALPGPEARDQRVQEFFSLPAGTTP